jgi:hypothetical protein
MSIRDVLIARGVANLQEFGYGHVTAESILTDEIYGAFFLRMLEDNQPRAEGETLAAINQLIAELNT